mgnify:CR=1 FL=1
MMQRICVLENEVHEDRFSYEGEPKLNTFSIYGVDQGRQMTREEALKIHKKVHEMSKSHLIYIKERP